MRPGVSHPEKNVPETSSSRRYGLFLFSVGVSLATTLGTFENMRLGQVAFEKLHPVGRCRNVWLAGNETKRAVEGLGLGHGRQRVQYEPRQAKNFRPGDEVLDESSTEPGTSRSLGHIQATDLTG